MTEKHDGLDVFQSWTKRKWAALAQKLYFAGSEVKSSIGIPHSGSKGSLHEATAAFGRSGVSAAHLSSKRKTWLLLWQGLSSG